ncbi:hypothetical protein N9383_04460 [Granulosicoccus sp.]|nr:hypothetical protein [Granulosicoccus sp.]
MRLSASMVNRVECRMMAGGTPSFCPVDIPPSIPIQLSVRVEPVAAENALSFDVTQR